MELNRSVGFLLNRIFKLRQLLRNLYATDVGYICYEGRNGQQEPEKTSSLLSSPIYFVFGLISPPSRDRLS